MIDLQKTIFLRMFHLKVCLPLILIVTVNAIYRGLAPKDYKGVFNFPEVVSIRSPKDQHFLCTGVLLTLKTILTSFSCINQSGVKKWKVYDCKPHSRKTIEYWVHPDPEMINEIGAFWGRDLTMGVLRKPFRAYAYGRQMLYIDYNQKPTAGMECIVIGWGKRKTKEFSQYKERWQADQK